LSRLSETGKKRTQEVSEKEDGKGSNTYHTFPGLHDIELDGKKRKVSLRRWRKTEESNKRNSKDLPQNFPYTYNVHYKTLVYIDLIYSSNIVHNIYRTVNIFFFIFFSW